MEMTEFSKKYKEKIFQGYESELLETDPEFMERFDHFVFDEVVNQVKLDDRIGFMAILAALLGCQGKEAFRELLPAAMNIGVTPVEVKEIVYQAGNTVENRRETGTQVQVEIFGEGMQDFWQSGPRESRHINQWLAENCFGDYYTRNGLDYKQREMITFCFLAAQGGCEPQLTSHAAANMKIGNDKEFLIRIISQCLPYIGYPRSLNALSCVNAAAEK